MKKGIKIMGLTLGIIGLTACSGELGAIPEGFDAYLKDVVNANNRGPAPQDFEGEGFTRLNINLPERNRYDNIYDEQHIPEQWENYGVGDPFLMRYNGEYYLYCSTRDFFYGFKVWRSHNLVDFEYLGNKKFLNAAGTEDDQYGQFAPEFYYWNGDFYAYGSPHGEGHYIYKSVDGTPYGDFKAVSGNIGHAIDGSVFIDDDESMYFLTAASGTIKAYTMSSMENISSVATSLTTGLVKWTEGPCIIKHDGTYFLSYTGNNVICDGYRVAYSYSTTSPIDEYCYPSMGTVALKTLTEQTGLGHSSTVLGPNLDSYYMSYHNLNSPSGPNRSYNINRVSFQGNRMNLYGPTHKGALAPVLPDFVNYDSSTLASEGEIKLSNAQTKDSFTAEWNAKGINTDGSTKFIFGAKDGQYPGYITINGNKIKLFVNDSEIGEGTLVNSFNFGALHTIRLACSNGRYSVYFDNLNKIDVTGKPTIPGGAIGYENVESIGTTTFSNDAFDSSDCYDAKPIEGEGQFFASNFMKESKLTEGSGVHDIDYDYNDYDSLYSEARAVKLVNPKDYVVYPLDVAEDALYGFEFLYSKENVGSRVSIQIDNDYPIIFDIKEVDFSGNSSSYEKDLKYLKQFFAEIQMSKGLHTMKIELIKGQFDLEYVSIFKDSMYKPDYSNSLGELVDRGAKYLCLWKATTFDGTRCHMAKSGSNAIVVFGSANLTDVDVSVDINLAVASQSESAAGILVRCMNPSLDSFGVNQSSEGYFTGICRIALKQWRFNYDDNTVNNHNGSFMNQWHNLRVVAKGNRIDTYLDGQFIYSYTDSNPFSHGYVGLYSINSQSYFKNFVVKGI